MPIAAVEAIERVAMGLFRQQLLKPDVHDIFAARSFAHFFHTLGFLYKYKPYGVKAASPFGYSLFDLHPGQGFSFQLHLEPKYEAFHILQAHPDSFIYLSTHPEWLESGEAAAIAWSVGEQRIPAAHTWSPEPGDIARITSTEIVHTVIGCTLEEYATTSFDAVERLLDQNDRAGLILPARHPEIAAMVHDLHPDLPRRLLGPATSTWTSADVPAEEPIIEVPGELLGQRLRIERGTQIRLAAPRSWVKVIVPTTSAVCCFFADQEWTVAPGQLFTIPPGWDVEVASEHPTVIAMQSIAPELVLREWAG